MDEREKHRWSPDDSVPSKDRAPGPRVTDQTVMMVAGLVIAVATVAIAVMLYQAR